MFVKNNLIKLKFKFLPVGTVIPVPSLWLINIYVVPGRGRSMQNGIVGD